MPWNFQDVFNTPWNIQHSFEHALQFSTCTEILNTLFQCVSQFSEHAEIFNMFFTVFRKCWNFQHAFLHFSEHGENFNMIFYNFQHSFSICFQHALQFSTCTEILNTLFQCVSQFSEHAELFNMFFTVFRKCWNFQHAFLHFSEHGENFNMIFYNFQHSFSICFQHALQFSTCTEILNTLFQCVLWNMKHENLKHLQSDCNWTHPEIFIKS